MSKPKGVFTLLTRGYPSEQYYGKLIQRNEYIYQNFNRHMDEEYPLIIFHEGNISTEHQNVILNYNKNKLVSFVDISKDFKWPSDLPMSEMLDGGFHPGYRLMCKFNCYHVWDYVKDYDYMFRVDEDTFIGELKYDVFQYMQDNNMDYLVGRFCEETHKLTNFSIPSKAHELLGDRWQVSDYDQEELWVPYSNLLIAKVSLFREPEVQSFLKDLTSDPRFLTHRWGDHVVQGIVLKAFSSKEKVSFIPDFEYMHGSHMCVSRNGRALEGILSPHEADVFDLVLSGKQPEHYCVSNKMY